MKSHIKTGIVETTTMIDTDTGEVIDTEIKTHTFLTDDKEQFFLIYSSLIGLLGELSNPSVKVLSYLLLNFKINSQFEIGGATRNIIANKMRLSGSAVVKSLTELKEKNILYSQIKSVYQINPRYAFQGSTSNRNKELKAIIELGCRGC